MFEEIMAISGLMLGLSFSASHAQQAQPFDTTKLESLFEAARVAPAPVLPAPLIFKAPPLPKLTPAPNDLAVRGSAGRITCDTRLDDLEIQTTNIAKELSELEQRMDRIRPNVREVMLMLQQPTSEDYCAPNATGKIQSITTNLSALPLGDFRDQAKANMLCGGSKTEEMQVRKDKARKDQDDIKILRLIRLEDRLLKTDQQAISLAENSEALYREGQRFLTGMEAANDLCSGSIDF